MRTDRIVDTVSVYNSECMGCERVERDIMVTFVCDPTMFEDFFLTQEQAISSTFWKKYSAIGRAS
jgi:hypothetical protein